MKQITLFILLFFIPFFVIAQSGSTSKGKITGKVKDAATNGPIEYATIAIYKQGTTQPINGTTSDAKGNFVLTNIPDGEYQVSIDFLGYKRAMTEHVMINAGSGTVKLNVVTLAPNPKMLNSVNITAQAATIENKIDKLVYNAGNDLTSQGGVATDILKKVPMVSVDIDGNVELLGSPSVKFLINGKPSSIFGASLPDALQSIPASQIKSIEVITSPGAKYDASGTGGIINIILKDNKVKGYNGSINLSAGTRLDNTSVNLNARMDNFGANLFFSGNKTLRSQTLNTRNKTSLTNDTTSNQLQNGYGYLERSSYQSGINFDWNLTKKDNLTFGASLHHFSNYNEGLTNQEDQQIEGNTAPFSDLFSLRNSNSRFGENAFDIHADYKKTFSIDGEELDISYTSSYGKNSGDYYQKQDYAVSAKPSSGSTGNNPGKDKQNELSIDYTLPLNDQVTFETGAKAGFESINSTSVVNPYNSSLNQFIYAANQSSSFNYSRNVYAYYVSASFPLFKFLDAKTGLRDEYTTTGIDFNGAAIPSYNFLSPSVVLSHQLSKSATIKIAYSKRIERPDFGDLNPFVNSSDPYNVSYGNPNLRPEIGNNFELGFNKSFEQGGNINVTAFYRHNGFDVKQYTVPYDSLLVAGKYYKNVYVTTRANVGAEVRTGINISGSLPVTKNFTLRPQFMASTRRVMVNLPNTPSFVSGYEYKLNMNASYDFKHNLTAEAFVNYESPRFLLNGRNSAFGTYNFAVRKQLMSKKASIGLTTNVPFSQYIRQSQTVITPGNYQYSQRQVPYRSFGISLSYKFGKLEFKKDKNEDNNNPSGMSNDQ